MFTQLLFPVEPADSTEGVGFLSNGGEIVPSRPLAGNGQVRCQLPGARGDVFVTFTVRPVRGSWVKNETISGCWVHSFEETCLGALGPVHQTHNGSGLWTHPGEQGEGALGAAWEGGFGK